MSERFTMRKFYMALILGSLFCQTLAVCSAADEVPEQPLRVGVKVSAPFVMKDSATGQLSGFSIDLIRLVAAQLDPPREIEFQNQESLAGHLETVREQQVDLGIAATSITAEREKTLDFSMPFHETGLDIVVQRGAADTTVWAAVKLWNLLYPVSGLVAFVLFCAHVIWITERGKDNHFDDRWAYGVSQAVWWTLVTMSTVGYGDFVPRSPLSRVIAVSVIVVGIVLFGIAVGIFTSALTVQEIAPDIQGPKDLVGQSIVVVRDTIAAEKMRGARGAVIEVAQLEDALAAVHAGEAFAVVHDGDQLKHSLTRSSKRLLQINRPFSMQYYGITFPTGSPLRERVNLALLEIMEGGEESLFQQLHDRWLGQRE